MRVLTIGALAAGLTYAMAKPTESSSKLTSLPLELKDSIGDYLGEKDIRNLRGTCHTMHSTAGQSARFCAYEARQKEVLNFRSAINAAMPQDGSDTDQVVSLLMPKLTPIIRYAVYRWIVEVQLGSFAGITPLGNVYKELGMADLYRNSLAAPADTDVIVIPPGNIDAYILATGKDVSTPPRLNYYRWVYQLLDEARPDLVAISDTMTVIPLEEAQQYTDVGDDSTLLLFALAHGYHRTLFDITRVLLDSGFHEKLRTTIVSGTVIPLSVLRLPDALNRYPANGYAVPDRSSLPTSKMLDSATNRVAREFAVIVVATLAAQGRVDETLAYLKDLEELIRSLTVARYRNGKIYDDDHYKYYWFSHLAALPFIASAQCGQTAAMKAFGPKAAKHYRRMTNYARSFDWKRATEALDHFDRYSGPDPDARERFDISVLPYDIDEDYTPPPWYLSTRQPTYTTYDFSGDAPHPNSIQFQAPMVSCTPDDKLSFRSYQPRGEVYPAQTSPSFAV